MSSIFCAPSLLSQCSDAGVCVIGEKHRPTGHSLGLSYSYGRSGKDSTLTFHTLRAEGTYHVLENADIYLGIPFSSQAGPAGNVSGIGDLTILWNQTVLSGVGTLQVQGGVKLATGEVNANSLSQAYQSGLGTNDILLGASYEINNITFAAAYQIATGRSANRLTRLKRGDDLMLHAGYAMILDQLSISGEILAIKRIQESSILQIPPQGGPETFVNVPNSNQLQVNLLGRVGYLLDERYSLQAEGAIALLKRDTNLDGLKRAFTVSIGLAHLF